MIERSPPESGVNLKRSLADRVEALGGQHKFIAVVGFAVVVLAIVNLFVWGLLPVPFGDDTSRPSPTQTPHSDSGSSKMGSAEPTPWATTQTPGGPRKRPTAPASPSISATPTPSASMPATSAPPSNDPDPTPTPSPTTSPVTPPGDEEPDPGEGGSDESGQGEAPADSATPQ